MQLQRVTFEVYVIVPQSLECGYRPGLPCRGSIPDATFPRFARKMTKRLFIETVGCQMNVLDSEMVVASLKQRGYEITSDTKSADAILFNTCSVREHAEEKVYSSLGKLKRMKTKHPEKIIGVIGCMAQNHQEQVFQRAPYVDMVVGPGQLHQIPDLLDRVRAGQGRQVEVSLGRKDGPVEQIKRSHETFDPLRDPTMRPTPYQAYVRIQIGCDKFCTYCIVPMVRGPEQGRPPEEILEEAKVVAEQGCLEVILLGQTVNSYQYTAGGKTTRLSDLLRQLHEIDGLKRLKFVTSYPKDMSLDLLENDCGTAEVLAVFACTCSKWQRCSAGADEARVHGGGLSRHDGPDSKHDPGLCCFERLYSRFFRGNGRRIPDDLRSDGRMSIQEQFYFQVQRPAGHESCTSVTRRCAR